jgi:peptidoglycan hydrolase CwlO-like protein
MKKFWIFFIFFALLLPMGVTHAQEEVCSNEDECQKKINEYTRKLSDAQSKAKTLANEIENMNTQINLTQLRIQNSVAKIASTQKDIEKLASNIEDIKGRLGKLQTSIDYQKKVLDSRMRSRYKIQESSPIIVLFGSTTINQLVHKAEYLQIMELQDIRMLGDMDKTKSAYNKQQDIFEDKKLESEQLKANLETEKRNLDNYRFTLEDQKEEKDALLKRTQNDEAKYQDLLDEARRELEQITGAVRVLKNQSGKEVKKGDLIGIQGNTGNSSGDHLHFGVYRYSSFDQIDGWNWYYSNYINPSSVLKSKKVYWDTGCESPGYKTVGSGEWTWPMDSPTISQGFGYTCWSRRYYGGKDHPAYDMFGAYGSVVKAVADGTAYFCRNCLGDGGNGVFIFHKDKYMTLYWHLR